MTKKRRNNNDDGQLSNLSLSTARAIRPRPPATILSQRIQVDANPPRRPCTSRELPFLYQCYDVLLYSNTRYDVTLRPSLLAQPQPRRRKSEDWWHDDEPKKQQVVVPSFIDAIFEIPDPKLLAGDLLFLLIINFLLQIANEVGEPNFSLRGGLSQPMTIILSTSASLLDVIVRDSKMSISWMLGALRQRSYSSSSVADDGTAIKVAVQVWVDYCSLRILLELGESLLFTHETISVWLIGREVWYTLIVMIFFRWAYSRFR